MKDDSEVNVLKIGVDEIKVGSGHRPINKERVRTIADSMKLIGLKTPISVRLRNNDEVRLVTGQYRLAAAKLLGWPHIDCIVVGNGQIERQLWTNAENLHRVALTKLERSEATKTWIRLAEKLRKGGQYAHPVGGRQPHDKGISKVAKDLGRSRRTVGRDNKIAEKILPQAKAAAEAVGLDQNQSAMLEIAKEPTSKAQLAKVEKLAKRKRQKTKLAAKDGKGALATEIEHFKTELAMMAEANRAVTAELDLTKEELNKAKCELEEMRVTPNTTMLLNEEIPGFLDRRSLSPDDQRTYDAVTAGWANSPAFREPWINAPPVVRHRFFNDVLLKASS